MISISPDVRKVQKNCFTANVIVDSRHLKQIKMKVSNGPFRKRGIIMWLMKTEWGGNEKKKPGSTKSVKRKWRPFSYSYCCVHVGGAGTACVSFPCKRKFGCLFRVADGGSP